MGWRIPYAKMIIFGFGATEMLPANRDWLCQEPDGIIRFEGSAPSAILPGAFNPLHEGHRRLAAVAGSKLNRLVGFEISIRNVDKPELAEEEVQRRLEQFRRIAPVYVTRAPTFEEKAHLFPSTTFIVGSDTAIRIIDPRYYRDDPELRDASLQRIQALDCRFLVAGRMSKEGNFLSLGGIEIPRGFTGMFEGIMENEFRLDLSSTMLRKRQQTD